MLISEQVAQCVAHLTPNVEVVGSKKLYPYCLVLVGSRIDLSILISEQFKWISYGL